jgi:AcrR family transcriptional regulator
VRSSDQDRNKRAAVIDAAIHTIARHGIAGLSYRRVARDAGVSLALVNYYFPQRSELIASSSERIFVDYALGFERAVERFRLGSRPSFRTFVRQAFRNAVWRDRTLALAWAELMLDAVRHEPSRDLAQAWQAKLTELWTNIAAACGESRPQEAARIGIDLVIG